MNKNDPNDARSVAVAALRSPSRREVRAEDHAAVLKVWSKRHRDLGRTRTQVACRLHAVLCELIPGGVSKEITAAHAAQLLGAHAVGAVEAARCELAAEFLEDLRRIDAQLRDAKKKLTVAVAGLRHHPHRGLRRRPGRRGHRDRRRPRRGPLPDRDHFAAYNGTAPIEVSSGRRKIYRLSRRGNRRLNHAIHMAAVTQISHRHSPGRAYYDRKLAEGKTPKEALRALKRRLSDAIFARSRPTPAGPGGPRRSPGGQGERLCRQRGRLTPQAPALRPSHSRTRSPPYDRQPRPGQERPAPGRKIHEALDAKRHRYARRCRYAGAPSCRTG